MRQGSTGGQFTIRNRSVFSKNIVITFSFVTVRTNQFPKYGLTYAEGGMKSTVLNQFLLIHSQNFLVYIRIGKG